MRRFFSTLMMAGALAGAMNASTIEFDTLSGATTSGGAVSDKAIVTTSAGQITIKVTDLLANPTDVAQLVSGFFFTLNGAPGTLPSTVTPTATDINIAGHVGTAAGAASEAWNVSKSGNTVTVTDLGGGQPAELIIGPGPYTNANGSINGNGPHNPFINQTATFVISAPGVTAGTTVSNFNFSFGTTAGINLGTFTPTVTPTPEPSTMFLSAAGVLISLGSIRKRRKA